MTQAQIDSFAFYGCIALVIASTALIGYMGG